jgi:hypothetical protein
VSETIISDGTAWQVRSAAATQADWVAPDARRLLQLALGALWLLDGVLQYQSVMFTKAFAHMLADSAQGNPALIADPITWSARLISQHVAPMNAGFATIQVLLGLGIAWRPTVRIALGASVAWALAVWWLGEGLGMVLTSGASPVNGAPGAVILYAVLAVLLWPAGKDSSAAFVAARAVGSRAARATWTVLWGSLAFFAVESAASAPRVLGGSIAGVAAGEPGWLASADRYLASSLSQRGGAASVVLAGALIVVAVGVWLPPSAVRAAVVLAVVVAVALWVAEGLGGILTGSGTDPSSGPPLALLALAYWPARPAAAWPMAARTTGPAGAAAGTGTETADPARAIHPAESVPQRAS